MIGTYWNTDPLNENHQEVKVPLPGGEITLVLGNCDAFEPGSGLDPGVNVKHPDGSLTPIHVGDLD